MKPNKGMFTVFLGPFPGFVSGYNLLLLSMLAEYMFKR